MKNKTAVWSGIFLILMIFSSLLAPVLSRHNFDAQDMSHVLSSPNAQYWFGTDGLGRDLFSRILYGARVSFSVGLITGALSFIFGTFLGALAGYRGGLLEKILLRSLDLFQSLPSLVLMILVSVILNATHFFENYDFLRDAFGMIIALSLVGFVSVFRLVHNQTRQIKEFSFVEAALASGASHRRIVFKVILPQLSGSLIVLLTYLVPSQILNESFLSFIGLGMQPPYSSWGVLANEGWRSFKTYPHLIFFPGMAIFLTLLASQFFGDGLRDIFDPQLETKTRLI